MHDLDYYGDKFKWFVGVAKELSPDNTKVRVRIFGIHKMNDRVDVSDGDLPYAVVMLPTTVGGSTTTPIGIRPDDWVVGFFADGDDCMLPVIIGVIAGGSGASSFSSGDSDPRGGGGDGGDGGDGGGGQPPDNPGSVGQGKIAGVDIFVDDITLGEAYDFLREKLSEYPGNDSDAVHAQAVAIMAHITAESQWKLAAYNWNGEDAWGLCQWRQSRKTKLHEMYGDEPGMFQQLSFIFWELENTEDDSVKAVLLSAQTPFEALKAFSAFERHAGVYGTRVDIPEAKARGRWQVREDALWALDAKFKDRAGDVASTNNSGYGGTH